VQELVGVPEMSGVDFGFGLVDQFPRRRVVRVQRGDLRLQSLIVAGDLGQCLGQLVVGDIFVLANDP
jgi:hypothetical protein